jgi:hypothetical protein
MRSVLANDARNFCDSVKNERKMATDLVMRKILAGDPKKIHGKFLGYDGAVRPWRIP